MKNSALRLLSPVVFTLSLFIACTLPVLATDITISATQIPNFQGSDGAIVTGSNASVTNNSTTVTITVSNGFRSSWEDLRGYRIALNAIDYTVASTAYDPTTQTGTITLTSAYAGSTGSVSWKVYPFVLLRIWATQDFVVSDGSYTVASGNGTGSWFAEYACSVISRTLYVPEIVLPSTVDAFIVSQRGAKYNAALYRPDGSYIRALQCGDNFQLQTGTPTTWANICQNNKPGGYYPPDRTVLSTTEIDARLRDYYLSAPGTTGRIQKKTGSNSLGDSILSESGATVTAQGNLTVTTNQSVGGTQAVSGAATFGSTVTLSADPATSLEASTKKFADINGAEIRAYQYADLGAAVTAIGSSTKVLQIGEPLTCNSSITVPVSLSLRFTGSGMITYASGCSITFAGAGVEASQTRQIFSGFTSNASSPPIKWSATYPDQISFRWFGGATSNTGAQNSNAWRLMFDAMAAPIGDGSSPSVVQQGALVYVPPSTSACYAFDDTAQITKPVILRGGASAGWYRNTCLSFPKGKTGIYVNGTNTWLSPYSSGPVQAFFSTIENITLIGGGYKHDAPTASADMTVDMTSGALTMIRNASDTTHTFGQDVAHDTTVTVNRYTYPIASKDSTTQITVHKPRFHVQVQSGASTVRMVSGFAPHTLSGGTPTPTSDWNGQQIVIDSKTYTISSISWDATFLETIINLTTPYSGTTNTVGTDCINSESPCHRGTAIVQSLNTRSAQTLYLNNGHGIDAKAQVRITNFHVRYFAGNGVHISTSTMPLGAANCGGCVNQNNSYVERGMIYNTAGHGIAVFGQETNSIRVQSVDVSVVKGACFLLGSFLGSVYDTTHCAASEHAPFFNPFGAGAAGSNRIINAYVEGSTPSSYLSQGDSLVETGGEIDQDSAGSYSNTVASFTNTNRFQISREYPYYNPGTLLRFGNVGNNGSTPTTPTIQHTLTLGTTEDPDNIAAGGTTQKAAPLIYFSYFPTATGLDGWWGLTHGGLAAYTSLAIASGKAEINYLDAEKITGINARSQVWFPRGLWLGPARHSMRRILSDSAAPASGQYFQGEVTFNQGATVGGNAGWIATAKGTPGPGTWNSFGWIYSSVSGSGTHQLGATITTPSSGQVLQWDGSKWINSASAGALLGANQTFSGNQTITGTLTLGSGGSAINKILRGSGSLDFGAISANACQSLTLTVTGAAVGDEVSLGIPAALSGLSGVSWTAAVTSSNTVTVSGCNATSTPTSDPASATVKATIIQ